MKTLGNDINKIINWLMNYGQKPGETKQIIFMFLNQEMNENLIEWKTHLVCSSWSFFFKKKVQF